MSTAAKWVMLDMELVSYLKTELDYLCTMKTNPVSAQESHPLSQRCLPLRGDHGFECTACTYNCLHSFKCF